MSRLTLFSVRNRALIALATVFAILAGLWSTVSLPRELFPSLEFPVLAVSSSAPGVSSQIVADEITDPVEGAVQGLEGVEEVTSTSSEGFSVVAVELDYDTELGAAQTELQRSVLSLTGLPEGTDTQVIAGSIDDFPILQMSATGGDDQDDLVQRLEESVIPEISDIEGVREVQLNGARSEVLQVRLDEDEAAAAEVNAADVNDLLQANGVVIPAGTVTAEDREFTVQTGGRFESVEEVASLTLPQAPDLQLSDVAEVELQPEETSSLTRSNGEPSVGLALTKTPEGNAVDISGDLEELIPELESFLDGGQVSVIFDQAPFIEQSIEDLTHEGLLGLAFAILVVLVFLLSVRLTLVTAVSIPLSLLIAMLGLQTAGYTLNLLTLGALTISVGRVVDDSIVVVENIKRHMGMGEDRRTSIVRGVQEVANAITSSTIATVAVFLPMGFVGGSVGELFQPFSLTVAVAMVGSLLVALTIVPVLAYWFVGKSGGTKAAPARQESGEQTIGGDKPDRLQRGFLPVLNGALRHPLISVVVAFAILAGTALGATALRTQFMGSSGENTLQATVEMPAGTTLEDTDAQAQLMEDWLLEQDSVESYQVTVGSTGGPEAIFTGGGDTSASFALALTEGSEAQPFGEQMQEAASDILSDEADLQVTAGMQQPGSSEVEVLVTAPDADALSEAASRTQEAVQQAEVSNVTNDLSQTIETLTVDVDNEAAAQLGLTEAAVGQAVSSATNGVRSAETSIAGSRTPIVVQQGDLVSERQELADITVGVGPSGPVPLSDVADIEQVEQQVEISRTDGRQSATITATPEGDDLTALTAAIRGELEALDLPEGAEATVGGVSAEQEDAFASLGLALAAAIAIVYLVLVATFNSLIQPLILLVSVPFAATGSLVMLLATDTALDVTGMFGLIMLIGIVVTNAIVLIDLINQYRSRGADVTEAVIEGARHRFRPIVMTALATIGALIPMALAITGGGAFISQPLALVVIGGLISSTALTLILVPVLYLSVERLKERLARRGRRHAKHQASD